MKPDYGRYPTSTPKASRWARAENLPDQFEDYAYRQQANINVDQDPPFTYSGAKLAACQFPVGGFGTGYVILGGDGTLQAYNIVNQVRPK